MLYTDHLRDQADRCLRAARNCPDPEFARALIEIGRELEQEADKAEGAARRRVPCPAGTRRRAMHAIKGLFGTRPSPSP